MAVFFVAGAVDRLLGNKFGLGAEFERGFAIMGPTALSVVGLMAFAPVLSRALEVVVVPVYDLLGADAGMFAGNLMSCDVGYPISAEMAGTYEIGLFGGLVVGSVMGFVTSFTIPVACGLIEKEHYRYFAAGILTGYIFDPLACFVGGIAMGLSPLTALVNLVPVIMIAVVVVLGLLLAPNGTIRVFKVFSKILLAVITVGLAAGAVEAMTGFVLIPGMNPLSDGFKTLGTIVLSLAGSLPLICVLRRVLARPLTRLGSVLRINDVTVLSMMIGLTSLVPGYSQFKDMNRKGRVVFAAFSASAACMFGSHLGFTSSIDQAVVMPMLLAKCCAGVMALCSAVFFSKRIFKAGELEE